jgi:hypothetical protein
MARRLLGAEALKNMGFGCTTPRAQGDSGSQPAREVKIASCSDPYERRALRARVREVLGKNPAFANRPGDSPIREMLTVRYKGGTEAQVAFVGKVSDFLAAKDIVLTQAMAETHPSVLQPQVAMASA